MNAMPETDAQRPLGELDKLPALTYKVLIGTLISGFVAFAGRGIWRDYSYWIDEIWSVAIARDQWASIFTEWLLPLDVHPPLYSVMLKLWIQFFGDNEPATRSLSLALSAATLVVAAWFSWGHGRWRQVLTLSFLGCSPAFAYYSQEVRSYALALFLATVAIGSTLLLREKSLSAVQGQPGNASPARKSRLLGYYYISAVCLSLTHYFGWILIFLLTAINLVDRRTDASRFRGIVLLLVMAIWPLIHVTQGTLISRTGGNFWIVVQPLRGTIVNFVRGVFPLLGFPDWNSIFFIVIAILLLMLWRVRTFAGLKRLFSPQLGTPNVRLDEIRYLILVVAAFLSLIVMIDLRTPSSTSRNFIVLIPAVAFLFSDLVSQGLSSPFRLRRFALLTASFLLLFSLLRVSYFDLSLKLYPHMNFKQIGHVVSSTALCEKGCSTYGGWTYGRWRQQLEQYFGVDSPIRWEVDLNQPVAQIRLPFIGIGGTALDIARSLIKVRPEVQCWEPPQSWPVSTFVLLDGKLKTDLPAMNFSRCRL
jgi:uncharacterized membrane protein